MEDLRYPIGPFQMPEQITTDMIETWIDQLEDGPANLRQAVGDLRESQLDTSYREGGWTLRQVVHHLADAQLNNYVRVKLACTEDAPVVRPWDEGAWAAMPDARMAPVEISLRLFEAVTARWAMLLRELTPDGFTSVFVHPTTGPHRLDVNLAYYVWHTRHHIAHITSLRKRMGW